MVVRSPFGDTRTGRGVLQVIFAGNHGARDAAKVPSECVGWLVGSAVVVATDWRAWAVG